MPHSPMRRFSTDFKKAAIGRLLSGEAVASLAAELSIARKLLYDWRDAWRDFGGEAGLNRRRGRKPGSKAPRPPAAAPGPQAGGELARARTRIAELEAKIGRQQIDIDFFRRALRLADPAAQSPAGTASARSSTP